MKDQILSFLKQLADKAKPVTDKALRFGGQRLLLAFASVAGLYWNLSPQNRSRVRLAAVAFTILSIGIVLGRITNVNRNVNVNQNTNVNVNRNVNVSGGYYGPSYHSGPSVAGVVAATVVTAAVVGTVVRSLPPSCSTVYVNGFAYQNCGGTYYQPQYQGSNVTYIVVNQP